MNGYGPKVTAEQLIPGTEIYYTGDMANVGGYGRVVAVEHSERWGTDFKVELPSYSYDEETGEETESTYVCSLKLASFQPGPGRRFWLAADWQAERQAALERFQAALPKRD